MIDNNQIVQFAICKQKEITGKGPSNVLVEANENMVKVSIKGFLATFEKQVLKAFPEMDKKFNEAREYLCRESLRADKETLEELIGGVINRADFEFFSDEDMMMVILEVAR